MKVLVSGLPGDGAFKTAIRIWDEAQPKISSKAEMRAFFGKRRTG